MMSLILKIDRWLLNNIFDRKRIFTINLEDCFDEYGNSYGKRGNHFFIKILELRSRKIETKNYLNQYYKRIKLKFESNVRQGNYMNLVKNIFTLGKW